MKIHNIRVKVYSKEKEPERLLTALKSFLPEEMEIKEEVLEPETEGRVFMHPIYAYTATVSSQRKVNEFIESIFSGLTEKERQKLLDEVERRVDEDCNFYMRLSKEELIAGKITLRYDDPVHVKVKVAAYPAKKENAVESVKKMIEESILKKGGKNG